MKKKTILLIVFISLAVFIIFGIVSCVLMSTYIQKHDGLAYQYDFEDTQETQRMDVSLDGVDAIEITGISDDVYLVESAGLLTSELNIIKYWKAPKLELKTYVLDDTAYVKVLYPETNIGVSQSRLYVGIPADFAGSVTIRNTSGNLYGDLKNNLASLLMETTSGDMRLSLNRLKDVTFKSLSGSMDLDAGVEGSLNVDTTSGDISIVSMDGPDADVNIHSMSGSMDVTYMQVCPTIIDTTSGSARIVLKDETPIRLDFSTTSGNLEGPIRTDPDGVLFDISSVSGDLSFE